MPQAADEDRPEGVGDGVEVWMASAEFVGAAVVETSDSVMITV
jgi:hypothetical protein